MGSVRCVPTSYVIGGIMQIKLTLKQWDSLVALVVQGKRAQRTLGIPLEIINGDQTIEIDQNEVKITLDDEE